MGRRGGVWWGQGEGGAGGWGGGERSERGGGVGRRDIGGGGGGRWFSGQLEGSILKGCLGGGGPGYKEGGLGLYVSSKDGISAGGGGGVCRGA